ncbi:MAG: TRAP transporter large permease subunit [Clostridia bacterium]|nr:TRAP transporter large permease subunit [Clostridia bacterium]
MDKIGEGFIYALQTGESGEVSKVLTAHGFGICLLVMLAVIFLWFLAFKRPIYEGILISFGVLLTITGTWSNVFSFIDGALSTNLLYSMMAFSAMSQILSKTKIIDNCVMIILSLLGRVPGGAGYAAVTASAFMGALSGSGPANVMATGTITIPAMIKSGYPPELAANVESASSYLGNMIPPSSNILAALGAYVAYTGIEMSTGSFWIACWGVSVWFILARFIQLFVFCKVYKIKAMDKAEVPNLKESVKNGWTGLLLPVIILAPFLFDSLCNGFIVSRLGAAGAKQFSSSLLIFVAGVTAIISILFAKNRREMTPKTIVNTFASGLKSLVPTIATCILGYMIGELFTYMNAGESVAGLMAQWNPGLVALAFIIPLICCFISMVIPGSAMVNMFGFVFISIFASAGANPLLVAAMLPCICGVMCGITPPFALGMYAGMAIAKSDFTKTLKNDLWWVAAQYVLEVIVLLGLLPVFGV